jgi:outer membrane protein assembly factor BamB
MLRRMVKRAGVVLVALFVVGGVFYLFGLRVLLTGGGMPYLAFMQSASAQADTIVQHRAAQVEMDSGRAPEVPVAPEVGAAILDAPSAPTEPDESASVAAAASPADLVSSWSDFRGPRRDGHYRGGPIKTAWPASGLTPMWKQPIGGGYASFVIANGRAFTIEQRGEQEVVAAYDVSTGREIWTDRWDAAFVEFMGGNGPRATPTWHDGHVYALGASGELRAIESDTGRVAWRTNVLADSGASNLQWGMSAAPLVVDDTVIVVPGGAGGQSLVAYDRHTGAMAWSALDDQAAYSSPMLVTLAGIRQLLVFTATRVLGVTPDRGEVLWDYPWETELGVNAGQPMLIGEDRVFVSSGYGTGAAVIEISAAGGQASVSEVWRNIRMKNQFASSVLHEGYIYGLDQAILACLDAETGELQWKGGRYGFGQVMLADGHLIVLTEDGDLGLVRATPTGHEEIALFPVLNGKTWNHPAMADGILLVRNLAEMAAFDLRPTLNVGGPDS